MNDDIATFAADFERGGPDAWVWVFACECGKRGCSEWVKLNLAAFGALRAGPDSVVLAAGHSPATRAQLERDLAADLREQARGLRGQARQQAARARRLRVTRDYRYELGDGETIILAGRLAGMEPLEVGDVVEVGGVNGTVVAVEPVAGDQELRLILTLRAPG